MRASSLVVEEAPQELGPRRELLWEQQPINDPNRPPTWRMTLEDFIRPTLSAGKDFLPDKRLIGEKNDLPKPEIALPGVSAKHENSFLV